MEMAMADDAMMSRNAATTRIYPRAYNDSAMTLDDSCSYRWYKCGIVRLKTDLMEPQLRIRIQVSVSVTVSQ